MNRKGFGLNRLWLNRDTIQAFSRRDRGKPWKPPVTIGRAAAKIRSEHLLNASLELYRYTDLLGESFLRSWQSPSWSAGHCRPLWGPWSWGATEHPPPFSAGFKNARSYTSTPRHPTLCFDTETTLLFYLQLSFPFRRKRLVLRPNRKSFFKHGGGYGSKPRPHLANKKAMEFCMGVNLGLWH
jgi:hypothetical protein